MSEAEIKVLAEEGKTKAVAAQATATEALDLAEVPVTQSAVENAASKTTYLEAVEEVRVRNAELLSIGNGA